MILLPERITSSFQQRVADWIAQRNPSQKGAILLSQRRLYILPTRFGYIYAAMLLLLLLAAINYENSMAYALTFLLAGLGIISLWQTHKNLLGLAVELSPPLPVHAGEQLTLKFKVRNSHFAHRYAVGIQYDASNPVYTGIKPEDTSQLDLHLPAIKRGRYKLDHFYLFSRYPTGLFHCWSWLKFELPVTIYPEPLYDVELKETLISQHSGKQMISTSDGDDFAGLREHHAGESLRHISWKAYAQGRGMLTKTFQGNASPQLWIEWSQMSATTQEGKLSQMAALVIQAQQQNRLYGLRLPGVELELDSSLAHKSHCLEQLALFQQSNPDQPLRTSHEQ